MRVDGNDLFAVIAVTRDAIRRASAGEGPTLIEAITYRMGGHSTSDDPTRYRDKSLLDPWADRDPLARIKRYLDKQGWFTDAEEQKLRTEIDARLRDVVEAAEKAPAPSLESMFDDVYASLPWHLREQRAEVLAGPRAPSAHH